MKSMGCQMAVVNINQAIVQAAKDARTPKSKAFERWRSRRESAVNTHECASGYSGDTREEYKHNLTDYRSENKVLAVVVLTAYDAAILNNRLKGTGLGLNRITGY